MVTQCQMMTAAVWWVQSKVWACQMSPVYQQQYQAWKPSHWLMLRKMKKKKDSMVIF